MAIAFRSVSTNTKGAVGSTLTITKPSGTVNGDLMIAVVGMNDSAEGMTPPAGWTQFDSMTAGGSGFGKAAAYYKIASGEGANYAWEGSDVFAMGGFIATYTGHSPKFPVQLFAHTGTNNSTSPVSPALTNVVPNSLLVTAYLTNTGCTMTPPSGMTERADILGSSGQVSGSLNELLLTATGTTGTKTATASTAVFTDAFSFIINPDVPIFRSSATGTISGSCNKPAGTVDGDVMIAMVGTRAASITPPAGWTQIRNANTTGKGLATFFKVASSEGSSYSWTIGGQLPVGVAVAIVTYAGVKTTGSLNVEAGTDITSATTTPNAPSVVTTKNNTLLLCFFANPSSATLTPPAGFTSRAAVTDAPDLGPSIAIVEAYSGAAGATGAKAGTWSTSQVGYAYTAAFVPNNEVTMATGIYNIYLPVEEGNVPLASVTGTGFSASTIDEGATTPFEVETLTVRQGSVGQAPNVLTASGVGAILDRGASVPEGGTEDGWSIQLNVIQVDDEDSTFVGEIFHGDEADMSDEVSIAEFDSVSEISSQRITSDEGEALKRYVRFKYTIASGETPGFVVAPVVVAKRIA